MSSISIRFPDGSREFRYPQVEIRVGDVLSHGGARHRVLSVSGEESGRHSATVERVPEELTDLLGSAEGGIQLIPSDEHVVVLLEEA
jgi:hypothetical protein